MRKIILTTIGSLGDLHPFIALALALKGRGFRPVLAVPEDHLVKARAAGLEAVAVLPGFRDVCARLQLNEHDAAKWIMSNQRHMLEQVVLPELSSCAARLDEAAADAEAIVSSVFVLAAPIVAEKRNLPLIAVILQPMAMLSAYDPPHTPDFRMTRHSPVGPAGARWNRLVYATLRQILHMLYRRRIDAVRVEHGLPPSGAKFMLEAGRDAPLTLCCYSPSFGPLAPDASKNALVVGFPMFDSQGGAAEMLSPDLQAFLDGGPAPLVFTLGSFAVHAAGNFYTEAATTARRLGKRAILLTGASDNMPSDSSVFACAYAPHSLLFPRAAAIIHHGGVGTTGQALRAGLPQLVVPYMGDQFDNAHRIGRMGVGRVLRASRFTARRATAMLTTLLRDETMAREAADVARQMAHADPAEAAAAAIEAQLGKRAAQMVS